MWLVRRICFTSFFVFLFYSLDAAYIVRNGKLIEEKYIATMSAEEHFEAGKRAMFRENWREANKQFLIISVNFPESSLPDALDYYVGLSYYRMQEYDLANDYLSSYLKNSNRSEFFYEVLQYKFFIADQFSRGAKKHIFGLEKMPKLVSGEEDALLLYEEIIHTLPSHDLAAKSFFAKAALLSQMENFKESNEAYQNLLRRFPKHELAPQAYLSLADLYLRQCRLHSRNPDLIDRARINLKKFSKNFPVHKNIKDAEIKFMEMQEVYAKELYLTGKLYERKKQLSASVVYYSNAALEYPETSAAKLAQERLCELKDFVRQIGLEGDF